MTEAIEQPSPPRRWHAALCFVAMIVAVLAVYCPPDLLLKPETILHGSDYQTLHLHRLRFVQEQLFQHYRLPGWYPRELMGTPFWSNVQDFPLMPVRLPLLLMDPRYGFAVGISLAAILSATFTYLFARSVGVSPLGAAVGGWTFACAGMFAGRVFVGHLPAHEGYLALPLMLWLVERLMQARTQKRVAISLMCVSLGTACLVVAPHPQLPVYGLCVAAIYAMIVHRRQWRRVMFAMVAIGLGAGIVAVQALPMWMLIQRSTRILDLNHATNDVAFPYYRLAAFFFPNIDGLPESLNSGQKGFVDRNSAYFWETVCYVGWMPIVAMLVIIAKRFRRAIVEPRVIRFLVIAGIIALVTALPFARVPFDALPGTILRDPSRQVYVTEFALAICAAIFIDLLPRWQPLRRTQQLAMMAVVTVVAIQLLDEGSHAKQFVQTVKINVDHSLDDTIRLIAGDGRVAIDYGIELPINRTLDDIGFFDSIMLAKAYAGLMDLAGADPKFNNQALRGARLVKRALEATGTRLVVSAQARGHEADPSEDIKKVDVDSGEYQLYVVPNAAERAELFPSSRVMKLPSAEIHERLRDPGFSLADTIMLTSELSNHSTTQPIDEPVTFEWRRPSSDLSLIHI